MRQTYKYLFWKKTPRSLNINVHHQPASKNWTHDYWKKTGLNNFYILLKVWSKCILVYKIKIVFITPPEKILDMFVTSYFIITEFPEYFFFLKNSIFYFSFMVVQNLKFENFIIFFNFYISFIPFKEGWSVASRKLAETILYWYLCKEVFTMSSLLYMELFLKN